MPDGIPIGKPTPFGGTPGMIEPGNIDLQHRPTVHNLEGTPSTVYSMSFNEDGKEILVPKVSDDGRILTDSQAIDEYHRSGSHMGKFTSPKAANAYAQKVHNDYESGKYGSTGGIQVTPFNTTIQAGHIPAKRSR